MRVIYGPVLSWRLGNSLGVDVTLPPKKCTYDCIYCQLGPTLVKTIHPAITLVSPKLVKEELVIKLRMLEISNLDYITISGSGEPTLNPRLDEIISSIRSIIKDAVPIAILTNASLFWKEQIRQAISQIDLVVAKIDTVNPHLFNVINRPHRSIKIEKIVRGIYSLRRNFEGMLAIQVMLLKRKTLTNASCLDIEKLVEALKSIEPDKVHLGTPIRPPQDPQVLPLPPQDLKRIARYIARELGVQVLTPYDSKPLKPIKITRSSLENEIMEILERRPSDAISLSNILSIPLEEVKEILTRLRNDGMLMEEVYKGKTFYRLRYAENT